MLRSMTGYGSATVETPLGLLSIEIQSVNRKYLETSVWMSKDFFSFEQEIKKWVAESVSRGNVTVRVQLLSGEKNLGSFLPESSLLKTLQKEWIARAKALGIPKEEVSLSFLVEQFKALEGKQEKKNEELLPFFEKGMKEALLSFCRMKDNEGVALENDILTRLRAVEKLVQQIETLAPKQVELFRKKLETKLADFILANEDTRVVLLREIMLFSDKVDIAEEYVRFYSHVKQFTAYVKDAEKSKGKKLDFLLQELNREIHTMGSKSTDGEISHLVVEGKSELEKIREQLQNVE